jgi:hypothetical protein
MAETAAVATLIPRSAALSVAVLLGLPILLRSLLSSFGPLEISLSVGAVLLPAMGLYALSKPLGRLISRGL